MSDGTPSSSPAQDPADETPSRRNCISRPPKKVFIEVSKLGLQIPGFVPDGEPVPDAAKGTWVIIGFLQQHREEDAKATEGVVAIYPDSQMEPFKP